MKNKLKITLIVIMTALSLFDTSYAQESFSVPIACIIPAVPGVNAPPFGEDAMQKEKLSQENKNEAPTMIVDETKKEMRLSKGESVAVTIQNIYSR